MATLAAVGLAGYRILLDGHMGRNRYDYTQETFGWVATWAAICLDSHMRLLEGHMVHRRYRQLQETLGWPHGPQ